MFHAAQRDSAQGQGADLVASEAFHAVTEREEELSYLPFFAVMHPDIQVGRGAAGAGIDQRCPLDLKMFALEDDAALKLAQPAGGKRRLEAHVVALHDHVGRVHESVGELAVGREDDQAFAVLVEAAGAKKAEFSQLAWQQVEDGGGVVRVVIGADEAARLVHGEGEARLRRGAHGASANGDLVVAGLDALTEFGATAVDPDFSGGNERLGGAAGTHAGVGEEFLQTDRAGVAHRAKLAQKRHVKQVRRWPGRKQSLRACAARRSNDPFMSAPESASVYHKDHPFPARLKENRLLNRPGTAKETRHYEVDISGSGLAYKVGDSLGIFPSNRPTEVAEIIERLGASGEEPVLPVLLKLPSPIPLREALASKLTLGGPTRKFLEAAAARASAPADRAKLAAVLAPEAAEACKQFLAEREFVDLLAEFPSAKFTPQEFVDHLRRLVPRLYSIASSPKIFPNEVHLTIATLRYTTNHRERVGVCSTFLADRVQLGLTPVPVFVFRSPFSLPEDGARDVIMVGPGTGVAPFRAFLQERDAGGTRGRNWLFFGEQHRATDFLYEEDWAAWLAKGRLARLDTAFSRDQPSKIYVQDRMRENAAELWKWIAGGAHFYVCGDATRMAKDVDQTLHDVIAEQGGMDIAAAAEYVKQMKKDRRYQRDVY